MGNAEWYAFESLTLSRHESNLLPDVKYIYLEQLRLKQTLILYVLVASNRGPRVLEIGCGTGMAPLDTHFPSSSPICGVPASLESPTPSHELLS